MIGRIITTNGFLMEKIKLSILSKISEEYVILMKQIKKII